VEIRANKKHLKKIRKALDQSKIKGITIRETDQKEPELVIQSGGEFVQKAQGYKPVISFVRFGFVDIRRKCPHRRFGKCIGKECSRYFIHRSMGDCGYFWDLFLKVESFEKTGT